MERRPSRGGTRGETERAAVRTSRRRALVAAGAGFASLAGLAGCLGRAEAPDRTVGTVDPDAPGAFTPGPAPESDYPGLATYGSPAGVCEAATRPDAVGIRAVVDPAYGPDWDDVTVPRKYRLGAEVDPPLGDGGRVIGVSNGASARAYPLSVVWWHEVVNDRLPGPDFAGPLLVTYCPICQSGMVAERLVAGRATTFGVTGHLWQPPREHTAASVAGGRAFGASATDADAAVRNSGNLVLYDEATRSYWSQLLARAICGPATGARLRVLPATVTTWGAWRARHPETDVLLPPPHSGLL
jgi:hypothetical protein